MKIEEKIYNYIKSDQIKSTLIGKVISISHNGRDDEERDIVEFSKWMAKFIDSVEDFAKTSIN